MYEEEELEPNYIQKCSKGNKELQQIIRSFSFPLFHNNNSSLSSIGIIVVIIGWRKQVYEYY